MTDEVLSTGVAVAPQTAGSVASSSSTTGTNVETGGTVSLVDVFLAVATGAVCLVPPVGSSTSLSLVALGLSSATTVGFGVGRKMLCDPGSPPRSFVRTCASSPIDVAALSAAGVLNTSVIETVAPGRSFPNVQSTVAGFCRFFSTCPSTPGRR